jgi:bisphosphoglycerate-dependent phosphoglycerate mutase
MIKPDMIPDEVWHTAMSTYHKTIKKRPGSAWQEAIAAALNAWPDVVDTHPNNIRHLVLQFKEVSDE